MENSMKNKMASEHVAAAGTDSNTKLKWSDDLAEDLMKALSNFKTLMEFQNNDSTQTNHTNTTKYVKKL